ncbi:MAG TPA: PAS domain-containing protein [Polyangiaceae bacterium]|nr:PAS domain-containing protein [Polyangiaceae bacterium]
MNAESFRVIVDNLVDGVLVVDGLGTVLHENPAASGLLGIPAAGAPVAAVRSALRHPDGSPLSSDLLSASTKARSFEAVAWRTGFRLVVGCGPLSGVGDDEARFLCVLRDVTVERRSREELARTQTFIDSILENIPDMIFVKDAEELRFERFNRAGEELLGMPRASLLGKTDFDFFPPEQALFFQERDRATLAGGKLVDIAEEPIDTARGRRWLHTKKIPILDEHGRPSHLLGISSDITERRAAEEALRQAHDALEQRVQERTEALRKTEEQLLHAQKLDAVGRLAGGVAHDFNNVLAVILGHVGLLQRGATAEEMQEGLESIRIAADHAAALTRQLLAFSRKQAQQPRILNLNRVVDHARGMLSRLLGEDIHLTTNLAERLGNVFVDPALIEQVIVNLAVNARDAMPQGGALTIATAPIRIEPGQRELGELRPGPYVCLRVSDTGCGMDETTRARIFEPFFTTKEPGKGTGLGLSMAYGVVTQSGGTIRVVSERGAGTTFSVYLPVAVGPRSETPPPGGRVRLKGGGETILLAEDESPLRNVLRSVLREAGYQVLDAADGVDALRVADAHAGPIHLLLSDVVMPRMTGPELARALRERRPEVRVLLMSGYSDDRLGEGVQGSSAEPPLAKPFTADLLTERVRQALDRAR